MAENKHQFDAKALREFASNALVALGLSPRHSRVVARILVEGDLLGHTTHGLALLPGYLASLEAGGMETEGDPDVLRDKAAVALWDGRLLPGPWLIETGFQQGVERARETGTFTLVIRRSHHTACLSAYLRPVTEAGMVALLFVSDPTERAVAPFGGTEPLYSTNPMAFGIPGSAGPLLIDASTSSTSNGMVNRMATAGQLLAHAWLLDARGSPSKDPSVRTATPPGTILPLGGMDNGHKGYGLGLLTEALTHGLSGNGRFGRPAEWQSNVFLQVIDPDCLGGLHALEVEMGALAHAARTNRPIDAERPVRVPGDRALAERKRMLVQGVELAPETVARLADCGAKLKIALPKPMLQKE